MRSSKWAGADLIKVSQANIYIARQNKKKTKLSRQNQAKEQIDRNTQENNPFAATTP